jgi:hypothetical protein
MYVSYFEPASGEGSQHDYFCGDAADLFLGFFKSKETASGDADDTDNDDDAFAELEVDEEFHEEKIEDRGC